jgi:hypothetical protein
LKVTHYPKVIDLISCLPAPLYRRALVKGTRRGARRSNPAASPSRHS